MKQIINVEYDNETKTQGSVQIHDTAHNLKIWIDFYTDAHGETAFDWNKYIFFMKCSEDRRIKEYQEDTDNFLYIIELVEEFLTESR